MNSRDRPISRNNPARDGSDTLAIRVCGIGKKYHIYDRPQDRLKQMMLPRMQAFSRREVRKYHREFWALRNINLEVDRGSTVGIVGRNGSGKSTLLQIICGTLTPSLGAIETYGRIAALLELGSGFNPEFTGRENVFLNGSILGLSIGEIEERFDAIAGFAEIGEFIDQPVKTYSSGMMLRLAFAVIANVDADILIIDEALAVGDALFNQRCMRFIRDFQQRGTLLFVSHDIAAVQNLCQKAIWLSEGRIVEYGDSRVVAENYLRSTLQSDYGEEQQLSPINTCSTGEALDELRPAEACSLDYGAVLTSQSNLPNARGWQTGAAEIVEVRLTHATGPRKEVFRGGEKARVVIEAIAHRDMAHPVLGFIVKDRLAQDLFGENTLAFTSSRQVDVKAGQHYRAVFEFRIPMLPNGQYVVMASAAEGDLMNHVKHHYIHDACILNVSSSKVRWGLVGVEFEGVTLEVTDG